MIDPTLAASPADSAKTRALGASFWGYLSRANLANLRRLRDDLFSWRRGSAQMVLQVSPHLGTFSIYSVLVAGVQDSPELYRYLLNYNTLQRREALGFVERDHQRFVVLKYTMELELGAEAIVQRHVYALQEIADRLDTELVRAYGGSLHFEDWDRMDQAGVDNLLDDLFG